MLASFLTLAVLALLLFRRPLMAGFAEPADFVVAFTSQMLGDLGLHRLELAGLLGGPELNYLLTKTGPLAIVAHVFVNLMGGSSPAGQLAFLLALHLLVAITAMYVAQAWRPDHDGSIAAGVLIVLHPLTIGALAGLSNLPAILAAEFTLLTILLCIDIARTGRFKLCLPAMLMGTLATSCDVTGWLAFPAAVLALFCSPTRDRSKSRLRRAAVAFIILVGVSLPVIYLSITIGPYFYLDFTPVLNPARWARYAAWILRGVFLTADPAPYIADERIGILFIAICAAATISLTAVIARRRLALLVWIGLAIVAFIPRAYDLAWPDPEAAAGVFAAFYLPMIFIGLWAAELLPGTASPRLRQITLVLMLVVVLPQTFLLTERLARRAEKVNQLGRELIHLTDQAPAGADIMLIAKPKAASLVEAAFLAAQYQNPPTKQVRFRLVLAGRLIPREPTAPLGRQFGVMTRLPFTNQNVVIGLNADATHLLDLTGMIHSKIALADDVIATEGHAPPEWPLVDETSINAWPIGANCNKPELARLSAHSWFVEAIFFGLQPHLGRAPL